MRQRSYWTDITFLENLESGYAMIKVFDLGKDTEEIEFWQTWPDLKEHDRGYKYPVTRSSFTIEEMIEHYESKKLEIDSYTGEEWPTDPRIYVDEPHKILWLAESMQSYDGWLDAGYPAYYTKTQLRKALNGYRSLK